MWGATPSSNLAPSPFRYASERATELSPVKFSPGCEDHFTMKPNMIHTHACSLLYSHTASHTRKQPTRCRSRLAEVEKALADHEALRNEFHVGAGTSQVRDLPVEKPSPHVSNYILS